MNKKIQKTVSLICASIIIFFALSIAYTVRAEDVVTTDIPVQDQTQNQAQDQEYDQPVDEGSTQSDTSQPSSDGVAGDATVVTGDAIAGGDVSNEVNTNIASTSPMNHASTTVADTNDTTLNNEGTSTAQTGSNSAGSSGGDATVITGNAIAATNVINVVNTNIINSQGMFDFFNLLFGSALGGAISSGFDLRSLDLSYFFGPSNGSGIGTSTCSFSGCNTNTGSLNITNNNNADITNTVVVRADSGGNTATSTDAGSAYIATGDAYASANVINAVNTNIVNSNYLLVALNNFGDMAGDITLPGASFFEQLFARASGNGLPNKTTITNDNTATVDNNTNTGADSGSNSATSTGDAIISTGDALSAATTVNQVNTNSIGGTTVYMLFNIIGNWSGTVSGLPAGMTWTKTPTGIALMGSANNTPASQSNGASSLSILNTNNATVSNNVSVYALTGQNYAATLPGTHSASTTESASSGSAEISTGNAYASANVVNMVNTNIIGQNWILAIFNIFGNWNGNLSFGHPDLWIGGVAETSNPTAPGSLVTYHFTVSNHGDADATHVTLNAGFNTDLLSFDDSGYATTTDGILWDLGSLARGETKEFSYKAVAGFVPSGSVVPVQLNAHISSAETDNNLADNSETLTIMDGIPAPVSTFTGGSVPAGTYTIDPKITMTKTVSIATTTLPTIVDYTVTLHNSGGPAYNTVLVDTLTDPYGDDVYSRKWDLKTIQTGDTVTLTYSVVYDADNDSGIYTNIARVTGQKGNPVSLYATDMTPVQTTALVELLPSTTPAEDVSKVDALSCAAFITGYLRPGVVNDPTQVHLLQYYLKTFEHENITLTGHYDAATESAVRRFQEKYKDDILSPWGVGDPTGVVYYTTQHKINELYCQGRAHFPLSSTQMNEIVSYRNAVSSQVAVAPQTHTPSVNQSAASMGSTSLTAAVSTAPIAQHVQDKIQNGLSALFKSFFPHPLFNLNFHLLKASASN